MNNTENVKKITPKKILEKVLTVIVTIYVICALIFSISIFTSLKTGHPNIFGYSMLYVKTNSMEGDKEDSIFVGDMVITKRVDTKDLKEGDIIAFDYKVVEKDDQGNVIGNPKKIVLLHRIVGKSGTFFITRGDNSPDDNGDGIPDDDAYPTHEQDVLGVYSGTRIPKLGAAIKWLSSQTGIMVVFVIPMALFFIYSLYKFIKAMLEYKMSKAPAGELSEEQKQKAIEEYLAKQAALQPENADAAQDSNDNSESDK